MGAVVGDGRRAGVRRRWAVPVALGLLTLVVFGPLVPRYHAQPASRYALTAALVEHGTVDLGRYERVLGVDHALYEGQLRSDKAIGGPLAAVPFYALGRAFGFDSAETMRGEGDLGTWWTTLWTSLVPFVVLLGVMYQFAKRFAPADARMATLAMGFGTMMLPHSVNLYGHGLAALCGFGAYVVAQRTAPTMPRLLASGALASAAVAVEYHAVIIAAVVFGAVAWRERARSLWMLVGAVPAIATIGAYQWRAFGAWYHTPFAYYAGTVNGSSEGGYTLPGWRNLYEVFLGSRGLIFVSPVVIVAGAAAYRLARNGRGEARRHAIVACVVGGAYVVLLAGWSGTPLLEEPGPRYAIPALPFLAMPLAMRWSQWRRIAVAATAVGATFMVLASFTFILLHDPFDYLRRAANGRFATTLWSMAFGPVLGTVVYVGSVALAISVVLRLWARPKPTP